MLRKAAKRKATARRPRELTDNSSGTLLPPRLPHIDSSAPRVRRSPNQLPPVATSLNGRGGKEIDSQPELE